jgi:ubiquitin carboxyl-terminal hydrolase 8
MTINNQSFEYDLHHHHDLTLPKKFYTGKGLSGLVNLGNKCFLNSILACLSNTLKLTDYFLSCKYKEDDLEHLNKRKDEYYLVLSYLNLIINAWEKNQILKPKSFVENISKFVKKYFTLEQQDSHECLMYTLDILHKGISYEIDVDIKGDVQNNTDLLMKQSLEQWKLFYEKNYSYIVEIFHGMFYNKIDCNNCDFNENIFEPFNCISLNIPESGSTNLTSCLNQYFNSTEKISTWNCEKCNQKGCDKSIKSWSLPNYLIIHLKRFNNSGKRLDTDVNFPIEDLNLTEYLSKDKQDPNNYIYSLYAVNYHSGGARSGHYWSVCKNLDNKWYKYNDADITEFYDTNNIASNNSYILFYYRKFIKN